MSRWSRDIKLANLDLNLLVALDALLQERSVTRAAAVMGVSQPALSSSLGKLRRHFGDELLTRVGNSYQLTPLGIQLSEQTAGVLAGVVRVFSSQPDFDPTRSEREFVVECSDYVAAVLGPTLMELLTERAPRVRLNLHHVTVESVDAAAEALRTTTDAFVFPHGFFPDNLPYINLFTDSWACLVSDDNTKVGDTFTMDHLRELPMVMTYLRPTAFTTVIRQLHTMGIHPPGQMVVEDFTVLPFLVAGSNRVALIQRRLAHVLASAAGVRVLPCPFDPLPLVEAVWWHPLYERDVGHRWLRELLVDAGRQLESQSAASTGRSEDG
jgi:DNA-binding transcriptional LysR family regulator